MKKEYLTIDEHVDVAIKLADIMDEYRNIYKTLSKQYTKTHPIMKKLSVIIEGSKHNGIKALLCQEWFFLVHVGSDAFKKYDDIYYNRTIREKIKLERI